MDSIEWLKNSINTILDPEKKAKEQEAIFTEKCEPLMKQLYEICKENSLPSVIAVTYGKKAALSITHKSSSPILNAVHELINLESIRNIQGTKHTKFYSALNSTIDAVSDALASFTDKKKGGKKP